ncbi:MAG: DUF411 domain-containing protein [Gammaproteobacteria bacterium]|nr:DUF411 domain-containing protein [Gammaproteobacteria bacterium]
MMFRKRSAENRRSRPVPAWCAAAMASLWLSLAGGPAAAEVLPPALVNKTPTCGCCTKWVDHLEAAGFPVTVREMASTSAVRAAAGVPWRLSSCHTAVIGDYWVEGHVPAEIIERLLAESPDDIAGLAVPGMPMGSPGMEGPDPVTYEVLAYTRSGEIRVYATAEGKSAP